MDNNTNIDVTTYTTYTTLDLEDIPHRRVSNDTSRNKAPFLEVEFYMQNDWIENRMQLGKLFESVFPITCALFANSTSQTLASCSLVCKEWHKIIDKDSVWNHAIEQEIRQFAGLYFGKQEWLHYFGVDVGIAHNFPRNICDVLSEPSCLFPGKTVGESHTLVLMPEKVNDKIFTKAVLEELVKAPKDGFPTLFDNDPSNFDCFDQYLDANLPKTNYWALMTNTILPDTEDKLPQFQFEAFPRITEGLRGHLKKIKGGAPYEMPYFIVAVVCIAVTHVCTGTKLFENKLTNCAEGLPVQGLRMDGGTDILRPAICFASKGILAHFTIPLNSEQIGLAAMRKF